MLFRSQISRGPFKYQMMDTRLATNTNVDKLFSSFYNKLNQVVNIHAPVSKRKLKRLSKPWITNGIRTSIRIKNRLFYTNKNDSYRLYRNKITTLIRISKKQYYHRYFYTNISNMKQTWIGINELINRGKKKMKSMNALKGPNSSQLIHDLSKLPTILTQHFATCGSALAAKLPHPERHYSEYFGPSNHINSFFLQSRNPG